MRRVEISRIAWLFPVLIICLIFTLFQGWIPHWGALWIFLLLGVVVSFMVVPSYYNSKHPFLCWLPYAIILFFNFFTNDFYWGRSFTVPVTELSVLLFAPAMSFYVIVSGDVKTEKRIVIWSIIVILIMSVSTVIIDTVIPGIVRDAARLRYEFQDNTMSQYLYRFAGSNYSLPHALPILFPALVFAFRETTSWLTKIALIVVLIFMSGLVWVSGAFTALILGGFSLIIALFLSKTNVKRNLIVISIVVLFILPLVADNSLMLSVTRWLQSFTENNSSFYEKLDETTFYLETGDVGSDSGTRMDLYKQSLETGFDNFFVGTNGDIGGHSAIIDHFATLGIFGLLLFLAIIISNVKIQMRFFPKYVQSFYVLGILTGFIMLLLKQMGNIEVWLTFFTLMPLTLHYSIKKT